MDERKEKSTEKHRYITKLLRGLNNNNLASKKYLLDLDFSQNRVKNARKSRKNFVSELKKKKLSGERLLTALEDACRGLIFISETDSEIVPVFSDGQQVNSFLEFLKDQKLPADAPIEQKPAQDFFERLTTDRDWHREEEKKTVRRFRKLRKVIFNNLDEMTLFRIGLIRIDIFVLGFDADDNIAGIRTKSVET